MYYFTICFKTFYTSNSSDRDPKLVSSFAIIVKHKLILLILLFQIVNKISSMKKMGNMHKIKVLENQEDLNRHCLEEMFLTAAIEPFLHRRNENSIHQLLQKRKRK